MVGGCGVGGVGVGFVGGGGGWGGVACGVGRDRVGCSVELLSKRIQRLQEPDLLIKFVCVC